MRLYTVTITTVPTLSSRANNRLEVRSGSLKLQPQQRISRVFRGSQDFPRLFEECFSSSLVSHPVLPVTSEGCAALLFLRDCFEHILHMRARQAERRCHAWMRHLTLQGVEAAL